jgi:hypothetical protein
VIDPISSPRSAATPGVANADPPGRPAITAPPETSGITVSTVDEALLALVSAESVTDQGALGRVLALLRMTPLPVAAEVVEPALRALTAHADPLPTGGSRAAVAFALLSRLPFVAALLHRADRDGSPQAPAAFTLRSTAARLLQLSGDTIPHAVAADQQPALTELSRHTAALVAHTMATEVSAARDWLLDGVLRLSVPIQLNAGGSGSTLEIDAERQQSGREQSGGTLRLYVPETGCGPVEATLAWEPTSLDVTFILSSEENADRLLGSTGQLQSALQGCGFAHAAVHVVVNPGRLSERAASRRVPSGDGPTPARLIDLRA